MSLLHLPFYIIFNSYYKHGNYKNDHPWLTVGGIFIIMMCAQEFFLYTLLRIAKDPYFYGIGFSKGTMYVALVINAFLVYLLYLVNGKGFRIYDRYKDKVWANSRMAKVSGWMYVIVSIASPFILIILRNAMIGRHLV